MPELLDVVELRPARTAVPRPSSDTALGRRCLAEAVGTFWIVFLGLGVVHAAVFTEAQTGLWQVAVVWGIAVALAIYATAATSGAHLNPALTAAFAAFDGFPRRHVLPYWAAQTAGAFAAAAVLHLLFAPAIAAFEAAHGIVRGAPESVLSAMAYGEYFPNPSSALPPSIDVPQAFAAELVATALLAFAVFALSARARRDEHVSPFVPLLIGACVAALISVVAPLTQGCFNPARDFGPRLFAFCAGWGSVAIPGPRGGFFAVYVIAPLAGALAGAASFRLVFRHDTPRP
jgi:glycerol uptake facilitator protein